jgi:hypothetical protein
MTAQAGLPDGLFFKPKIPNFDIILVGLRVENVDTFGNVLQTFGTLYDHLLHFVFVWCKKNLATLGSRFF